MFWSLWLTTWWLVCSMAAATPLCVGVFRSGVEQSSFHRRLLVRNDSTCPLRWAPPVHLGHRPTVATKLQVSRGKLPKWPPGSPFLGGHETFRVLLLAGSTPGTQLSPMKSFLILLVDLLMSMLWVWESSNRFLVMNFWKYPRSADNLSPSPPCI